MVDTLAPKKIYKQRELDKSLTPSPVTKAIMTPGTNIMSTAPRQKAMPALVNMQQSDYIVDSNLIMARSREKSAPMTGERNQTVKSSEETTAIKQTGNQVKKDVAQGLGSSPIAYAQEGFEDKIIDRPVVVGEKGMEMIVPTGKGKFTVVNNEALKGLMSKVSDDSNVDLSKDTVSEFKNEDGTDRAAITGNDKVPDPKIGSADTLILIERLQDQGIDTTNKDLRKSIMDYIEGGDNTYYDELLNPPEVEIIPKEKVQPLMGKDEV